MLLPIPTYDVMIVEEAVGSFIAWPRSLVEVNMTKGSRGPNPKRGSHTTSQPLVEQTEKISYDGILPKMRVFAKYANTSMLSGDRVIYVEVCKTLSDIDIVITFNDISWVMNFNELSQSCITTYMR